MTSSAGSVSSEAITTQWVRVLLLCAGRTLVALQVGKVPPALAVLREDLQLDLVLAGWVISAFNVVAVLGGMAIGTLAEQLGHRRTLLAGLVVSAVGSLLGALANGAAVLLATRVIEGIGFLMAAVAVPPLLLRVSRVADHRFVFGIWGTYFPAGFATMLLLSPLLLPWLGWRGLWSALAMFLLLAAAGLAWMTRDLKGPVMPVNLLAGLHAFMRTMRAPGPLLLAACFCTYSLQFMAVMGFLPLWLIEQRGLGEALAAGLAAVAVASNVAGNLAAGWLLGRGASRAALIVGASIAMALCGLTVYQEALVDWLRFVAVILFSAMGGLIPSSLLAATPRLAPGGNLVATTNGLLLQGSNGGQLLGPPLLALLVLFTGGWQATPVLLVAAASLTALIGVALGRVERRIAEPPR